MKILCLFKGGRKDRIEMVSKGRAPQDFFYGTLGLKEKGFEVVYGSSNVKYKGILGKFYHFSELVFQRINKLGIKKYFIKKIIDKYKDTKIIISFTDGLSLTLGILNLNTSCKKIGCFHCLSDIEFRSSKLFRYWINMIIEKSLSNLNTIAFFGDNDRKQSIKKYNINPTKTALIKFGVDTDFWVPKNIKAEKGFFSIGQDPGRDFQTLINTTVNLPIHIHTDLKVKSKKNNIKITNGSFFKSSLTDLKLRKLYQNAIAVVVPLKNINQPSGYSVTLQAMSCGKLVILTKTKGLWDKKNLISGFNCILVEAGNVNELSTTLEKVFIDKKLRLRIGTEARRTVQKHYNINLATRSLELLLNKN